MCHFFFLLFYYSSTKMLTQNALSLIDITKLIFFSLFFFFSWFRLHSCLCAADAFCALTVMGLEVLLETYEWTINLKCVVVKMLDLTLWCLWSRAILKFASENVPHHQMQVYISHDTGWKLNVWRTACVWVAPRCFIHTFWFTNIPVSMNQMIFAGKQKPGTKTIEVSFLLV